MIKAVSLKTSSQFTDLAKNGQRLKVASFLTLIVSSADNSETRFGIIVSKKVGNAVLRNKLKRWVRHCVQSSNWINKYKNKTVVFMFRSQPENYYKKLQYKDFIAKLQL